MPILEKNFGTVRADISKFYKTITNKLFVELKNKYSIVMNTIPVTNRRTILTFTGEGLGNSQITLEFSSNHKDLAEYPSNSPVVFVQVYYNAGGEDGGILDLSNISDSAEQIYSTLYSLGYRTLEDAQKEKEEKERIEKEKVEEQKRKNKEKADKLKAEIEADKNKPSEEPEPEEVDTEANDSIEIFNFRYDKILNEMIKANEPNSKMVISIAPKSTNQSYHLISVDITYISKNLCLVETSGVKPEVDKTVSWSVAKKYCNAVVNAVDGAISIEAIDAEGKDIIVPDSDKPSDDDDLDLGINI